MKGLPKGNWWALLLGVALFSGIGGGGYLCYLIVTDAHPWIALLQAAICLAMAGGLIALVEAIAPVVGSQ